MADTSKIEWTDSTFNPWIGCDKVGPGCDHCYAEDQDKLWFGGNQWGPKAPRQRTKTPWAQVRKWQRDADAFEAKHGRQRRAFCGSLCDIMDNKVSPEWSEDAFELIEECDRINWQLLTKRVGNAEFRVPLHWLSGVWPQHVGLMITVVNQKEADRDIPKLLALKAKFNIPWVGISYEPALGPIDLRPWLHTVDGTAVDDLCDECGDRHSGPCEGEGLDWVIAGGESGRNARWAYSEWFRAVRDQCAAAGVPFLLKQWGEWLPIDSGHPDLEGPGFGKFDHCRVNEPGNVTHIRVGKKHAGRELDGRTHDEFPEAA